MTIIYTVARMNPPTPGHLMLIENMMEEALYENVEKIHIILSSKVDCKKNPLEPEEKRYLMETYMIPRAKTNMVLKIPDKAEWIDRLKVNVMLTHEYSGRYPNDILGTVNELLLGKMKGEKIIFMTGEDGFPVENGTVVKKLDRKKMPISGTIVRASAFVSYNNFAMFYPELPKHEIDILYDAMLELEEPPVQDIDRAREYYKME